MGKGGDKLFILDGHSLAYRAFYALPLGLKTSKGLHTNAVLGFTNMLLRLLKDKSPDFMVTTFDYPAPTFRHRSYSAYKATREKTPAEMKEQVPLIKDILTAFRITISELEGYEADDLIGTFALQAERLGLAPFIVTADADAYQLLSPRTKLLITRKGITQLEEFNVEKMQERYGLTPSQWVDFKALKGDSSDNIPGVPGIGEKRALQLLKEYGSLENILAHSRDIPGKVGESLQEYAEQALLSKDLATIRTNVPVSLQLEECRCQEADWESLFRLFKELEFNTLIEKIPELSDLKKSGSREALNDAATDYFRQSTLFPDEYTAGKGIQQDSLPGANKVLEEEGLSFITDDKDLEKLCRHWQNEDEFSLLLNMGFGRDKAFLVGAACALKGGEVFYIPFDNGGLLDSARFFKLLGRTLETPGITLVTHDLKPLLKLLAKNGVKPACSFFDTLLAAYLIEADRPAYHLPVILEEYLGLAIREPEKGLPEGEIARQRAHFLGTCARHLFALRETLLDGLEARRLKALFFNLELPLVGVLAKMELRGIRVREDIWDKLAAEMDESMALLEKEIMELAGEEFNLNSPRQLSYILFEKLKLPVIRRIKTGYSTDARVLQELSAIHPVAAKIMEYRTVAKLKTTYLEGLRPFINPETGKIHTTFNQTVTATGRLSSKDPNLQNIPVRLEEGRRLRQAFIPSSEDNLLLSADYSQIELRIMAHLSRDPNLIDAFLKDQDIHTRTAAEVFNVSLEEVTPLMRNRAKAVNFGIIYGISDYGLSQDLQIPRAEARKYIENYFNRYTGVKRYVDECIKTARENGYVTTVMDRRRYLPDINHSNYSRRSFAERIARNTPVQGSAADIIKSAMLAIDRELEKKGFRAAMLLQVHDELIFEVPPEELAEVAAMVKSLMEGVFPLAVPLKVDLKVGRDWYHLDPLEGG